MLEAWCSSQYHYSRQGPQKAIWPQEFHPQECIVAVLGEWFVSSQEQISSQERFALQRAGCHLHDLLLPCLWPLSFLLSSVIQPLTLWTLQALGSLPKPVFLYKLPRVRQFVQPHKMEQDKYLPHPLSFTEVLLLVSSPDPFSPTWISPTKARSCLFSFQHGSWKM